MMCEFKVMFEDEKIMEDVIYASLQDGGVILRDIIGNTKHLESSFIKKVDVLHTELVLGREK